MPETGRNGGMAMICSACAGTKSCGPCDGSGEFEDVETGDAFECEVCGGDGVCVECGGTAEIEDPDQIGIDEIEEMGVGE
jgi:primosomal protein N'